MKTLLEQQTKLDRDTLISIFNELDIEAFVELWNAVTLKSYNHGAFLRRNSPENLSELFKNYGDSDPSQLAIMIKAGWNSTDKFFWIEPTLESFRCFSRREDAPFSSEDLFNEFQKRASTMETLEYPLFTLENLISILTK